MSCIIMWRDNRTGTAKKHQSAGFRTYMLVCLGSTLTMLLGQYEYYLTHIAGSGSADVSRLGAQVINGIGFIATGTILVTDRQEVKGLTTGSCPLGICMYGPGNRSRIL